MIIREPLTFKTLSKYVDDYSIFRYYCPGFTEVGIKFKSPFRNESKASAVVYSTNLGNLRFNDFVLPTMSSVEFVSKYFSISLGEALNKVALDFKVKEVFAVDWGKSSPSTQTSTPVIYKKAIEKSSITVIQVRYRKWNDNDIIFWKQFGITLETLALFHVYPIDYFWINGKIYKAAEYSYSYNYYWEDGVFRRKIYQPYDENKWFSNGGKIVQGEGILPKEGDLLIITKSLKDVMTLYELGYTSIAPTTEKTLPSIDYINKQKSRFKKLILFLDNDETGKEMSVKHSKEFDIPYILIPNKYECKDISDFVKKYGEKEGKKLMKKLIKL